MEWYLLKKFFTQSLWSAELCTPPRTESDATTVSHVTIYVRCSKQKFSAHCQIYNFWGAILEGPNHYIFWFLGVKINNNPRDLANMSVWVSVTCMWRDNTDIIWKLRFKFKKTSLPPMVDFLCIEHINCRFWSPWYHQFKSVPVVETWYMRLYYHSLLCQSLTLQEAHRKVLNHNLKTLRGNKIFSLKMISPYGRFFPHVYSP